MAEIEGLQVQVRGIVQGVGFRPFVYALALRRGLTGWVRNTSSGVDIEVHGAPEALRDFTRALRSDAPPLSRIDEIETRPAPANHCATFEIVESQPQPGDFLPVSPDFDTCPDCRAELFAPGNRRFRYPFINCTNCGPRFTIIRGVPYDRPNTTMAGFPLCPDCQAEYADPLDRRFHAQPVACPTCGPHIWYENPSPSAGAPGKPAAEREAALQLARQAIQAGKILAVKGLGGFHLACSALDEGAVSRLRQRKQRVGKPFAVMAFDLQAAARYCLIRPEEQALLESPSRPIVLLERRPGTRAAADLAPHQKTLGVMLAYTPLHLLLCEPQPGYPDLLVMTSGNLSEEPVVYQNEQARASLAGLADGFLMHDRPIEVRVDDSVVSAAAGKPYFVRRSRGYAPEPIRLGEAVPPVFAVGAELKNTFCLTRGRYAFVSHHIGDMQNYETYQAFETGSAHFQKLFGIQPEALACDLHPDYLSSRFAHEAAARAGLPLVEVQHHHAHLAACLAENGWTGPEPVIGLCFDGTGLGTDGAIWGGEVLVGGCRDYQRAFHLAYTPLPGGDLAVRKPARMALAHLWQAGLDWEPEYAPVGQQCYEERTALRLQLEHRLNTPLTSSMGRLFDAVSALLGVCEVSTYEGQAAIELEAAADPTETGAYPFEIGADTFSAAPLLAALLADWRAGVPAPVLAGRFHNSLAGLAGQICQDVRRRTGISTAALSGGVWQNRLLLEKTLKILADGQFTVLTHRLLPPNDGSLSLGQALVAIQTLAGRA
jgi:hydrogenase maturation protein HypF